MRKSKEKAVCETAIYATPAIHAVCLSQQKVLCGSPVKGFGTEQYVEGDIYDDDDI